MAQFAKNVYTDAATIEKIETWIRELPQSARVEVTLADGSSHVGTVAARPMIQVFKNVDGDEGSNAVVRLEDPMDSHNDAFLWLDEIVRIDRVLPGPLDPGASRSA
ncbi:DUF3247 family protein [Coralloluteibacterium stylophorae]|uniref:DUF3247 family protein n=1 Tax=Coralloluteibacterium stylophorae TaxID=1776034 RepID=A0AAP2CAU7_9GAMM|nr:DUF3247 family protein [Coralloluteibacterium stylophorae]MBS7457009.1 DUF3247 family protein [Coralloluteibacterium stylophorae]